MAFPSGGYSGLAAAVADGLRFYWPFDEESGSVATDEVESVEMELTANVTDPDATVIEGKFSRARHIAGSVTSGNTGIVLDPGALTPPSLSQWTVSIWIRATSFSAFPTFMSCGPGGAQARCYAWDEDLSIAIEVSSGLNIITGADAMDLGEYHLLTITQDATTQRGYIDATELDSASATMSLSPISTSTVVAYTSSSGVPSNASADDFAIWDRALSSGEISEIWNSGAGTSVFAVPPVEVEINAVLPALTARIDLLSDWTANLDPRLLQDSYVLRLEADGFSSLELPISSWQATANYGDRQSYVQGVVPAVLTHLDAINDRVGGQLVILMGYRFSDGSVLYEEVLRSSFSEFQFDRGPRNATGTLSGYANLGTIASGTRTARDVQQLGKSAGLWRLNCALDMFLRPGMTVETAQGVSFEVGYINYYVNRSARFCQVGERQSG